MKTIFISIIACFITFISFASQPTPSVEKNAISDIIEKAYIQGLSNGYDLKIIKKYIHKDFICYGIVDNKESVISREKCMNRAKAVSKYPETFDCRNYKGDIKNIDINGNTAIVKVILMCKNKACSSEFLSLVKINNKWVILNKLYTALI